MSRSLAILTAVVAAAATLATSACKSSSSSGADAPDSDSGDEGGVVDITDAVLTERDADCQAYVGQYTASVTELAGGTAFTASVEITSDGAGCSLTSNGIPNHDFGDGAFATPVAEVVETFDLPAPADAASPTALTLMYDNGVFLNGVKLDLLAAACYGVGNEPLGQEKIGCMTEGTPWRYDPMHPGNEFGTDSHNAHTQPDGAYHYHGDPEALYDAGGGAASGVIGFAADGYPIYGPFFDDGGTVRRAVSGYTLKSGARQSQAGEGALPDGDYDGTFVDDYEFSGAGDLDECNGMTRDGSYGYYVTDGYPWVLACFKGTPDPTFAKMMGG